MLARMRGLKRKLNACAEEETRLYQQSQSRIRHLGELYTMQSLDDVKYEDWSRTRLDRLLVDYLLRHGYTDSATALSKEKNIQDLVDVETFVQMSRIRESLRNGRVTEALSWCNENKKDLRRMPVSAQSEVDDGGILIKVEQSRVYASIPTIHRTRTIQRAVQTQGGDSARQKIPRAMERFISRRSTKSMWSPCLPSRHASTTIRCTFSPASSHLNLTISRNSTAKHAGPSSQTSS